jgi:hypothetical protein
MAPKPKKQKPFDIDVPGTLADDLVTDIQGALDARASVIGDGGLIDLADFFYEQGRSDPKDRPFVGAADLTSYFIYEKVSALRARLMKAVFGVRPFCFVEGWGEDAKKAPYVEEFHDWQVRKGDLPLELYKTVLGALLEDGYVLEVSERIETRRIVEELDVALELHPDTQGPILENGQPKIQLGPDGEPVPAQENQPSAKIKRDYVKTKRLGPQFDAISMKDFVFLPGHAKNQKQVYGYASRVYTRVPELQERAKDGVYDAAAVETIGDARDRESAIVPAPVDTVQSQEGPTVEVELWQVSLKRDLDGDGREEWYLLTVHLPSRTILRCKLDTFVMRVGMPRCVPFVLFPRRNSVYGYSYAYDALLTLAEEHTALRNMKADRGALATNAPMKVLQGALYDPEAQPIGVGRAIYVREMNEVQPLQIPDVPASAVQQTMEQVSAVERVSGLSDSAVGVLSQEQRTLGEQRLVAGGSAVRVDEVVGHMQWAIAQVMQLCNAIWIDTLEADQKGLDAPGSVTDMLQARGVEMEDGKFTAAMLKGNFEFVPLGSDATADPQRQRGDFNAGLEALANLGKVSPALNGVLQDKDVAQGILEQFMRVYNWRDRQRLLKAFKNQPVQMPTSATPGGGPAPMGAPVARRGLPPALAAMLGPGGPSQEPRLADNEIDPHELEDLQQLVASPGFRRFLGYVAEEWGADAQMRKIDAVLRSLTPGNVDGEYTTVSQVRAAAKQIHQLVAWPDTRVAQLKSGKASAVASALDRFRRGPK